MKRILLTVVLLGIILSPSLVQACSLALPRVITVYAPPPEKLFVDGDCIGENCLYQVKELVGSGDSTWQVVSSSEIINPLHEDWKRPIIAISSDWEEYTALDGFDSTEKYPDDFFAILEFIYTARLFNSSTINITKENILKDSFNNVVIILDSADTEDRYIRRETDNDGCPEIESQLIDGTELITYDSSGCEWVGGFGGMCPSLMKKSPFNVYRSALGVLVTLPLYYPWFCLLFSGGVIGLIILVVRRRKRKRKK